MELRVEATAESSLPPDCFVGVRVGDVLKQGRYEPQRCYHFPKIERRRNAKIDLYQHVGSCMVAVDPESRSTHEVAVTASGFEGASPSVIKLWVNVQAKGEEMMKQREARTKAVKEQAKDYLSKHGVEEQLSEAVKALLKEQPDNPMEFICRQLLGGGAEKLIASTPRSKEMDPKDEVVAPKAKDVQTAAAGPKKEPAVATRPVATKDTVTSKDTEAAKEPKAAKETTAAKETVAATGRLLTDVRQQACNVLMNASNNGLLESVLGDVFDQSKGSTAKAKTADKGDPVLGKLRQQACDALLQASSDGRLDDVLSNLGEERQQLTASDLDMEGDIAQPFSDDEEQGTSPPFLLQTACIYAPTMPIGPLLFF
mmetsp:Transcript_79889/g.222499  ORF Transcript_79889/g.222499 Transcript_79889/m.222499 type:complete len:370 (+) Transcript_79889:65-1174(+)